MEHWRPVVGWEKKYEVSDLGRVRSVNRHLKYPDGHTQFVKGKQLFLNQVNSGYLQVSLYNKCRAHKYYVHQLVASAFIPNPNRFQEIHHKDYDKTNNAASNLEWTSHLMNIIDLRNTVDEYKDSHNKFHTHTCATCGVPVSYGSKHCRKCAVKLNGSKRNQKYKHRKLGRTEIKEALIRFDGNFTRASREFDMTDNALRKWCKKYGLPTRSKEWKLTLRGR